MARKVFISFLGTSPYTATYYHVDSLENSTTEPLRFVQEASLLFHCSHFNENDKVLIFVTNMANKANWLDDGHVDRDTKKILKSDGLKSRLAKTPMAGLVESFFIKDGNSTDEIWEIFSQVYEQIELNDEIYFDVTHAFRSIPMLFIVLINYAKLMKNITVAGIYYGAFEAKILKEKDLEGKDVFSSPIWDLKSFSELQDWTNAVDAFINFGNGDRVANLLDNTKIISNQILALTRNKTTVRGKEIYEGETHIALKELLSRTKTNFAPLTPLLQKIDERLAKYGKNNIENCLYEVDWCIDNNMIQQATTLLLETVITYCVLLEGHNYMDETHRNIVNSCFKIIKKKLQESDWIGYPKDNPALTKQYLNNPKIKDLSNIMMDLTAHRNDFNHAGFKSTNKPSHSFYLNIRHAMLKICTKLNLLDLMAKYKK